MTIGERMFSVREPLIAIISLILLSGFLLTNISSYYVSKGSLRETLINNELPLTSNNIYSEIQRDLLQPVFVSSLMANDTLVKDWLLDGEQTEEKISRYLDQIHRKYDVFTSFLVSESSRNYYHFTGISQVVSETDPRDAWYFRVREMAAPYELNVDLNAEANAALTIFINHRVKDYDGEFLAAVGVGLEFDTVSRIVDNYKASFGRNIYFINEDGEIQIRSSGTSVTAGNIFEAQGLSSLATSILASEQGFFEYERDGEAILVSTRQIPELGWHVIVEQREADALSDIRQSLITNLLIGFAVIIVTILIISYVVNHFHARLQLMATTDKLTGIGNRSLFDVVLQQAIKRYQRDQVPFTVILVDIDHFKSINDTFGHLEGDEVIKEIVGLMKTILRGSDVLCRWGGDELIVLAHSCTLESGDKMAENICTKIEKSELFKFPDGRVVTVSIGITQGSVGDTAKTLIQRADKALYAAKQAGRNCIRQC